MDGATAGQHLSVMNFAEHIAQFHEQGYLLMPGVVDAATRQTLKQQLADAIAAEAAMHRGSSFADYGMLLAAPVHGGPLLRLVENEALFEPVNALLGDTCIIHVYTSSSLPPFSKNYGGRIHHERSDKYPDIADFVGLIALLDDFTEENGATWFLPGSHKRREAPTEESFYKNAQRLLAPAGSVFYFDWRLYHAGGENNTQSWRHALAMGVTPAYHKQKIDLPRAIPEQFAAEINVFAKQKLGFYSIPPVSIEEYYKPPEERSYRQRPV